MFFTIFAFWTVGLHLVHLDHIFADLGPSWGHLGPSWAHLGAMLGNLGPILGPSWAYLGPLLGHLGPSWGRSWAVLGPSCAILGPSWGCLGAILGRLGPSWVVLGPTSAGTPKSMKKGSRGLHHFRAQNGPQNVGFSLQKIRFSEQTRFQKLDQKNVPMPPP